MADSIIVRDYTPKDLRELILIYQQAFAEPPWNESWGAEAVESDLRSAISQQSPIILVAENTDRKLLGFTWGYTLPEGKFTFLEGVVNNNASYMDEIAVSPTLRKKGVGKLLGENYIQRAILREIPEIVLRTDQRNTASMALFTSLGFKNTGIFDPQYNSRIYLRRRLCQI